MKQRWLFTGFLMMALAVALGAFGAHGLKARLSAYHLGIFEKAVLYHFVHSLGIIVAALSANFIDRKWAETGAFLLFLGVIGFSGSLYLLANAELMGIEAWRSILGPITPIGGTCFIGGWLLLAAAVWKADGTKQEIE